MSRNVFVGNIPYEATEDQLIEFFSQVGPVVSFRLVHDRDTSKPRGFGFCEFRDPETAQSAMRNLNGRELLGRPLRVGHATEDGATPQGGTGGSGAGGPPPPPPQQQPNRGRPAPGPQGVTQAVEAMSGSQLSDVLARMKVLAQQAPDQARAVLAANPQLAYALLHAEVLLGMLDHGAAQQMLRGPAVAAPVASAVPPPPPPLAMPQYVPVQVMQPPPPPPTISMQPIAIEPLAPLAPAAPPQVAPPPPPLPVAGTAPIAQQPQPPPPPPTPQQQQQLIGQIMAMTQDQIDALEPSQREQVLEIRAMILGQQGTQPTI